MMIFPEKKNKVVIPSHTKGATNDVDNYRPISLLFVLRGVM